MHKRSHCIASTTPRKARNKKLLLGTTTEDVRILQGTERPASNRQVINSQSLRPLRLSPYYADVPFKKGESGATSVTARRAGAHGGRLPRHSCSYRWVCSCASTLSRLACGLAHGSTSPAGLGQTSLREASGSDTLRDEGDASTTSGNSSASIAVVGKSCGHSGRDPAGHWSPRSRGPCLGSGASWERGVRCMMARKAVIACNLALPFAAAIKDAYLDGLPHGQDPQRRKGLTGLVLVSAPSPS